MPDLQRWVEMMVTPRSVSAHIRLVLQSVAIAAIMASRILMILGRESYVLWFAPLFALPIGTLGSMILSHTGHRRGFWGFVLMILLFCAVWFFPPITTQR